MGGRWGWRDGESHLSPAQLKLQSFENHGVLCALDPVLEVSKQRRGNKTFKRRRREHMNIPYQTHHLITND